LLGARFFVISNSKIPATASACSNMTAIRASAMRSVAGFVRDEPQTSREDYIDTSYKDLP